MEKIRALGNIIDNINTWIAKAMAILILPILGLTLFGVIMRYLVHQPLVWGSQVLLLIFIPVAVLAGGYVIYVNGHVRVDVLYSRWGPRGQAISDAITFIALLIFGIMLARTAIEMAWVSTIERETSWQIFHGPIYPKKIVFALSVILLLLSGITKFVRDIRTIMGKGMRDTDQ